MHSGSTPSSRPASESAIFANALSCIVFFGIVMFLGGQRGWIDTHEVLWALAAAMLPMMAVDIRRQRAAGAYASRRRPEVARVGFKLLGLWGTFGLMVLVYWVLPEYRGDFYDRFYALMYPALGALALLAVPYFYWMDARQDVPEDGCYHMGLLLCGRWSHLERRMAGEHVKAWAVKGFFLPLMGTYLFDNIQQLVSFSTDFPDFMSFYRAAYHACYSVDLLFACTGYLMTLRLLNTQIYSAEPTALGWAVCLMCYQPAWGALFYPQYFSYDDGYYWDHLVAGMPILRIVWGMTILLCLVVYGWATLAFGYRFSNLTYRGLISSGPYRFTKHPAYVFKCASWWLISVPFIVSEGMGESLRQCLMLSGLCFVYFLRARTEENHLSNYPEYVNYANWMNTHGMFAALGRWLPFLAYDEARAQRSHSRVYAPYAGRTTADA